MEQLFDYTENTTGKQIEEPEQTIMLGLDEYKELVEAETKIKVLKDYVLNALKKTGTGFLSDEVIASIAGVECSVGENE